MLYLMFLGFVFGVMMVLFSPSPFFGMFGVLVQSLCFSALYCIFGFPFFGLLIILIYMGGMLIVFLFSTVLSAERYPEAGFWEVSVFWVIFSLSFSFFLYEWAPGVQVVGFLCSSNEVQLGELFGDLGGFTCVMAFVLLVALMVVLSLGFEHSRGSLRKL